MHIRPTDHPPDNKWPLVATPAPCRPPLAEQRVMMGSYSVCLEEAGEKESQHGPRCTPPPVPRVSGMEVPPAASRAQRRLSVALLAIATRLHMDDTLIAN